MGKVIAGITTSVDGFVLARLLVAKVEINASISGGAIDRQYIRVHLFQNQ